MLTASLAVPGHAINRCVKLLLRHPSGAWPAAMPCHRLDQTLLGYKELPADARTSGCCGMFAAHDKRHISQCPGAVSAQHQHRVHSVLCGLGPQRHSIKWQV